MITGYKDEGDNVFCVVCWKTAKAAGGAASILDSDDPADPGNVFWVVDKCVACGADVKYKDVRLLA